MPSASAASCRFCRMTPASHVTFRPSRSMAAIRFNRLRESTSASPLSSGVAPPTMPLLPPCGTIGTPCVAQSLTNAATSSVDAGEARPIALPV